MSREDESSLAEDTEPEEALGSSAVVRPAEADEAREVIYGDEKIAALLQRARQVAATSMTVLLTGESGVGKEVFAKYIHRRSPRAEESFIALNCAALPPTLLESELFGHEKGAFSGAVERHIGMFERANGGTILLDEISEMAPELQAKLLRVLQERTVKRVGGYEEIELDMRVIATSNRDLVAEVENGNFRKDLYYRLNVFPIDIPPLRARRGDVEPLVRHYLAHFSREFDLSLDGITRRALDRLTAYDFPGNVRELINLIKRAAVLAGAEGTVDVGHFDLAAASPTTKPQSQEARSREVPSGFERNHSAHRSNISFRPGEAPLTDIRRDAILKTLERFDGNRSRAADALGVSERTVRNRLKRYKEEGRYDSDE